jgi:hypothetical protein
MSNPAGSERIVAVRHNPQAQRLVDPISLPGEVRDPQRHNGAWWIQGAAGRTEHMRSRCHYTYATATP